MRMSFEKPHVAHNPEIKEAILEHQNLPTDSRRQFRRLLSQSKIGPAITFKKPYAARNPNTDETYMSLPVHKQVVCTQQTSSWAPAVAEQIVYGKLYKASGSYMLGTIPKSINPPTILACPANLGCSLGTCPSVIFGSLG